MRRSAALLWLLAPIAAYGLGVWSAGGGEQPSTSLASFSAAIDQRDPLLRSFEISRFLRELDPEDLSAVLETIEAAGFWFKEHDYHLLMAAWTPHDAPAAMDWALSRPGSLQRRASAAAIEELAFYDPVRALSFVASLESREMLTGLHLHMAKGWARSDHRDGLTEYLAGQPASPTRRQAATALANELMKEGADAVIAWFDAIPEDASNGFERTAFRSAAGAIAQVDPGRAARWVAEHRGQRYATGTTKLVAEPWIERDPAAAMDWLVSLPEGKNRVEHIRAALFRWVSRDARAAEDWVAAASPRASVDPAVRVLVHHYAESQPAVAMKWAERIHNPAVRSGVLASRGREWLDRDRDAFLAWLPESGLEPDVRDLILSAPHDEGAPGPLEEPDGLGT